MFDQQHFAQFAYTPLHFASEANAPHIISLLLEAGANITAKSQVGINARDVGL